MTVRSVALSWCGAGTPGLEAGVPDGINAGLPVCAIAGRAMASDNSEAAVNTRSMGLLLEGLLASQRQHVGDQRVLLFLRQLEAEHQVEEFDRVGERQQAAVVEVRRRILDAAQRQGLDRAIRDNGEVVHNQTRGIKALQLQVMHIVVEKRQLRHMTCGAAPLAHEDLLAGQLLLAGLGRIKLAERIERSE